jgi:hypothetical protein
MPLKKKSKRFLHLSKRFTNSVAERNFRAHFGVPSFVCELLYDWCLGSSPPPHFTPDNLFLVFYFLKSNPPSWEVLASKFHLDIKTVKSRITDALDVLDRALPEVLCCSYFFFFKFSSFNVYFSA